MKNIIIAITLSFITCTAFAKTNNIYKDFTQSARKDIFLKNHINKYDYIMSIIGTEKCENVSKIKTLVENKKSLYLQVSCSNIQNDFHIFMKKAPKTEIEINSCEAAVEKFEPELNCKEKL